MSEQQLGARTDDEGSSLLPGVASHRSLPESGSKGPNTPQHRTGSEGTDQPPIQSEGPEAATLWIDVDLTGKIKRRHEILRLFGVTVSDRDQRDPSLVEFILDTGQGSSLLPTEQSTEMAKKRNHRPAILPEAFQLYRRAV